LVSGLNGLKKNKASKQLIPDEPFACLMYVLQGRAVLKCSPSFDPRDQGSRTALSTHWYKKAMPRCFQCSKKTFEALKPENRRFFGGPL
jgi:hypothetical protein